LSLSYLIKLEEKIRPRSVDESKALDSFVHLTDKKLKKEDWKDLPPAPRAKAITAWVHDHIRLIEQYRMTREMEESSTVELLNTISNSEEHIVERDLEGTVALYLSLARTAGLKETRFVMQTRPFSTRAPRYVWAETSLDRGRVWIHVDPFWAIFGSEFYDCRCHRKGTEKWYEGIWENKRYYVHKAGHPLDMISKLGLGLVIIAEKPFRWTPPDVDIEVVTYEYV